MEKDFNEQEDSAQDFQKKKYENTEETYQKDTTATGETTQAAFVNENIHEEYMNHLRKDQNIGMAVLAGFGASILGGILWAVVTVASGWQIGFMAVGVGLLVGFAVRFLGKGVDIPFGIIGAVFSLLGCVFGNFLTIYGMTAQTYNVGYFEVLSLIEVSAVIDGFIANIGPMDLLFYGLAIYEGYRFATISPTDEDLLEYAAQRENV